MTRYHLVNLLVGTVIVVLIVLMVTACQPAPRCTPWIDDNPLLPPTTLGLPREPTP